MILVAMRYDAVDLGRTRVLLREDRQGHRVRLGDFPEVLQHEELVDVLHRRVKVYITVMRWLTLITLFKWVSPFAIIMIHNTHKNLVTTYE